MKRLTYPLVIAVILIAAITAPIFAIEPPLDLEVVDIMAFQFPDGGQLYVFEYNIEYGTDNYSTTPASESWVFRLYDTDGTTLKASTEPYVFPYFSTNGYGYGASSIYFSASDNVPTWGSALTIELYGWPAFYTTEQKAEYTLATSDYSTANTSDEVQAELASYIFLLSDRLSSIYEDSGVILKTSSDAGIVLSTYGELYFRGAVPGLQTLCPEIFFVQVYVPERLTTSVSVNMSFQEVLSNRLDGDDLGRGFDRWGDLIGVSGKVAAAFINLILCLAVTIWLMRRNWGIEPGIGVSTLITTGMAYAVGDAVFTILILAGFVAAMVIAYIIFIRRSA